MYRQPANWGRDKKDSRMWNKSDDMPDNIINSIILAPDSNRMGMIHVPHSVFTPHQKIITTFSFVSGRHGLVAGVGGLEGIHWLANKEKKESLTSEDVSSLYVRLCLCPSHLNSMCLDLMFGGEQRSVTLVGVERRAADMSKEQEEKEKEEGSGFEL